MLLSKATYIAFQSTHFHSYQSLLSLGIEPMTLMLQAPVFKATGYQSSDLVLM